MTVVEEPGLRTDVGVWPAITKLASCLCLEVDAAGLPDLCFCGVMPGGEASFELVTPEKGVAWVRLDSAWPSTSFPEQLAEPGCAFDMAYTVEIGVAYCAPVAQDRRGAVPAGLALQFDSAMVQTAALAVMRHAIQCCFGAHGKDVLIGQYAPFGPAGGVVGGTWDVTIADRVIRG